MHRPIVSLLVGCCAAVAARAQAESPSADVANAIELWVGAYEAKALGPQGELRLAAQQPAYLAAAQRAGMVREQDFGRLNHLDVLQKMLFFAEKNPDERLAEATLAVAGAGLAGAFLDHVSVQLRELGHWTLMRMEDRGAWFVVLRIAGGQPLRDGAEAPDVARRVAALRALGQKAEPVFATTIAAALRDAEPRVRIAAAEALALRPAPEALPLVLDVLPQERHAVAAQALAQLLLALLRDGAAAIVGEARERVLRTALSRFGQAGWRTDMELLDVVELLPHKAAVPLLIDALALASAPPDRLVKAVNEKASPRRKQRVVELLRLLTGALIPGEDVSAWREFWRTEGDRLVVPEKLTRSESGATRAAFFGVPVTGGAIAFLIDTSGSMGHAYTGTGGGRRADQTRLGAAKEQLGLAVQAMDPEATFLLVSFAAEAHVWTAQPVKAGTRSLRSLTELTSRLAADGGTNLFDGLVAALRLTEARFGEAAPAQIDELFVLSDGQPTTGAVRDPETILTLVREANRFARVRIHTVFTGNGDGATLLRRLADENGGVFVQR